MAVPASCQEYQRRIEAAQRDCLVLSGQEVPEEVETGNGEMEMTEVNSDLVQRQLLELAQQVMHVIEACNEEKEVLEEKFD